MIRVYIGLLLFLSSYGIAEIPLPIRIKQIFQEHHSLLKHDKIAQLKFKKGVHLGDVELLQFLKHLYAYSVESSTNTSIDHYLFNEILVYLLHAEVSSDYLVQLLLGIAKKPEADPVIKDYALQFVYQFYPRCKNKEKWTNQLLKIVNDSNNPACGTALLSVYNIYKEHSFLEMPTLTPIVERVLLDEKYPEDALATALEIAAEQRNIKALPMSRKIITGKTGNYLKFSAIRAIGEVGTRDDLQILKDFVPPDIYFIPELQNAMHKLNNKI